MAKKTRTAKIKAPFFQYSWYKEINKPETNKQFIQQQIDSFEIIIKNESKIKIGVYKEELETFFRLIVAQGHLAKLDNEYQDKFLELNQYYKKQYGGPGVYLL